MAVRIRQSGEIVCADIHPQQEGDMYIDDNLHYYLSAKLKLLVTEPNEKHRKHGKWWWINNVPEDADIADFYKDELKHPERRGIMKELHQELTDLLNRYSKENESNTPDYILAEYMLNCLSAWTGAIRERDSWYGINQEKQDEQADPDPTHTEGGSDE